MADPNVAGNNDAYANNNGIDDVSSGGASTGGASSGANRRNAPKSNLVKLRVIKNGRVAKMTTTRETLIKFPGSKLAKMFEKYTSEFHVRWEPEILIKRNPDVFPIILDYLRSGRLALPWLFNKWTDLMEEAKFYELPSLIEDIKAHPFYDQGPIHLNVGGSLYSTCVETISSQPDSMLARMFLGQLDSAKDDNGAYFIDRNGTLFRYVLNYLRTGTLELPASFCDWEQLREEAEFFQLGSQFIEEIDKAQNQQDSFTVTIVVDKRSIALKFKDVKPYPESPLREIFFGVYEQTSFKMEDNKVIIDRDGIIFRYILNYLQNGRPYLPVNFNEFDKLKAEATFFKIDDLVAKIDKGSLRITRRELHMRRDNILFVDEDDYDFDYDYEDEDPYEDGNLYYL